MIKAWNVSWIGAAVLVVIVGSVASVRADLSNGDFESGDAPWVVLNDDAFIDPEPGNPSNHLAVLLENEMHPLDDAGGSYNLTGISQSFSHTPGEALLHFDYKILTEISETDHFQVWLGAVLYLDVPTDDFDLADGNVHHGTLNVSLLAGNDLEFRLKGYNDGNSTVVEIDNVCIAPVPVPGAVLLGALGLGSAGHRLRRRS